MASVKLEGDGAAELQPLRICAMPHVSPEPTRMDFPDDRAGRGLKRPRREEAALFLEKTYELLERCPSDVASWTDRGDSFVVKQPAVFAEHVIPTYFKHRKFSSFVRQLNLYGFRKVRTSSGASTESDELEPRVEDEASLRDWWEFRHDRFVRGRRELLCAIKRRCPSDARGPTPSRTETLVARAEFDELRGDVSALRHDMHQLQRSNEHLARLLQRLLQQCSRPETTDVGKSASEDAVHHTPRFGTSPPSSHPRPLPSISVPSPTATTRLTGPQQALLQLRQGLQPPNTPREVVTPRTPASSTFQLRPLQSLRPPEHRPPTTPLRWYHANASPRAHSSPCKRQGLDATTDRVDSHTGFGLCSPEDVAVRELSRMASEIRTALLACITARITGFVRVHCEQSDQTHDADADAVAHAVNSDIGQQLARLQASTSASDWRLVDAETTCMYRVEILKFISRELPRAVQDAVDKRLPAAERLKQRSAKDRSRLALLVQKAQKALECQMHLETAAVRTGRR